MLFNEALMLMNCMLMEVAEWRIANRDEQDSRTFEIPACGTPVISEFSKVHSSLFQEDTEMLFFKNKNELLQKVNFLLNRPDFASKMAETALLRSSISGYDHESRIRILLDIISNIK